MSLSLLIPLVVFGTPIIVILVHILGGTRSRRFVDETDALAEWVDAYPDTSPREVIISKQGDSALVLLEGAVGLLWALGDDAVARVMRKNFVRTIAETPKGLSLVLNDFDAPRVALSLDTDEARNWRAALAPYVMGASLQPASDGEEKAAR